MTDTMAKYQKITDYQAKYLDVSKGIIDVLEKNDRQMEYLQYDIKAERCRIDSTSGTVTYLPSREDSYERLLEGNKQFPSDDEDVDDAAIKDEHSALSSNAASISSNKMSSMTVGLLPPFRINVNRSSFR